MATSMHNLPVFFLLLFPLVTQLFSWKLDKFPNPNKDVNKCGRVGVKSWVCDPDEVLKKEEADTLEGWLMSIYHETDSGCGTSHKGKRGYEVGIAVVKSMELEEDENAAENAERFAKYLHDNWGIGKELCNDGGLIFLSVNDRQVYISTGQKTKERLTNEQINLIIENIRPFLRAKEYGKALEESLRQMKDVLEGRPLAWSYFNFGTLLFCSIFALAVGCIISSYYNQKKYKEFKRKLGRIDQEREDPKEYKALVCPICLEDFQPQIKVKLLMCGHKYCEPCLTEWLKTKTSCPICRQNVNRNSRDTEGEMHDGFMELSYRLSSLHNQYPHFITTETISHWLSPDFHGSFMNDMSSSRGVSVSSYDGSLGSSSDFGGGSSHDGGGSGGSW